jgi:hypothetical protein
VTFNTTSWYIEDVLSINNDQFHSYVNSMYHSELEIKDTTECFTSTLCLYILLKLDVGGKQHNFKTDGVI